MYHSRKDLNPVNRFEGFKPWVVVCLLFVIGLFGIGIALDSGQGNINGRNPFQIRLEAVEVFVDKIDAELHTVERFCGVADTPSFPTTAGTFDTMTAYQATAGNDTWGDWLHVMGSSDTPTITGKDTFDVHEVAVSNVSTASFVRMQIGWNATTTTAIISDEAYTEVVFRPSGVGANVSAEPIGVRMPDQVVGILVWVRVWIDGQNGATVDFFLGTHEFDV